MTTSALPHQLTTTRVAGIRPVGPSETRPLDRAGLLALAGPLLLFVHGILAWVDRITDRSDAASPAPATTLEYAAGSLGVAATVVLVASVAAFAGLAAEILRRPGLSERLSVGTMLVAGLGVVTIALPFDLVPIGALLVLIGLSPLVHDADTDADAVTV